MIVELEQEGTTHLYAHKIPIYSGYGPPLEGVERGETITEKQAGYLRLKRWVLRLAPLPRNPSFFRILSLWRHTVFSEMPKSAAIWAVDLSSLMRAAIRISVEVRLAY